MTDNGEGQNAGNGQGAANGQDPVNLLEQHINQPHIARISVRAPPFWKENPALWFTQLESQFHTNAITVSETKYHIAVAALDTAVISQVSDIILNPPAQNKYETLKQRLQDRYADSEERRFKKLLGNLELGDKKPSHLWREMKDLAGNRVNDNFLRSLWQQRLPAQMQAILSTDDGDMNRMLVLADKIFEIIDVRGSVCTIDSTSASNCFKTTSSSSTSSQLEQLRNQMDTLTQQIATLTTSNTRNNSTGSGGGRQRNRSISRLSHRRTPSHSRSRNTQQHPNCWYHYRYGDKAIKCSKPCEFVSSSVSKNK